MANEVPVRPVGKKIIVFPEQKKEENLNGVIIPMGANAQLSEGIVVEVSDEVADLYRVGDTVLYHEGKGVHQNFNGAWYLWLNTEPHLEEVWGIKK